MSIQVDRDTGAQYLLEASTATEVWLETGRWVGPVISGDTLHVFDLNSGKHCDVYVKVGVAEPAWVSVGIERHLRDLMKSELEAESEQGSDVSHFTRMSNASTLGGLVPPNPHMVAIASKKFTESFVFKSWDGYEQWVAHVDELQYIDSDQTWFSLGTSTNKAKFDIIVPPDGDEPYFFAGEDLLTFSQVMGEFYDWEEMLGMLLLEQQRQAADSQQEGSQHTERVWGQSAWDQATTGNNSQHEWDQSHSTPTWTPSPQQVRGTHTKPLSIIKYRQCFAGYRENGGGGS